MTPTDERLIPMRTIRQMRVSLVGLACVACVQDLGLGQLTSSVGTSKDASADTALGIDANVVDAAATDAPSTSVLDAQTVSECLPVKCKGQPKACADCIDNDGDGLMDHEDPDCWGPCDDSETTFTGGERNCPELRCYYDADCGSGNDADCALLAPNGCDCWGCCLGPGMERAVTLGSLGEDGEPSCTAANLDDPAACQSCTLDESCYNPCDECELCFGETTVAGECGADASP